MSYIAITHSGVTMSPFLGAVVADEIADSPSRCCRWFRFGDPCLLRMTAHWILL